MSGECPSRFDAEKVCCANCSVPGRGDPLDKNHRATDVEKCGYWRKHWDAALNDAISGALKEVAKVRGIREVARAKRLEIIAAREFHAARAERGDGADGDSDGDLDMLADLEEQKEEDVVGGGAVRRGRHGAGLDEGGVRRGPVRAAEAVGALV